MGLEFVTGFNEFQNRWAECKISVWPVQDRVSEVWGYIPKVQLQLGPPSLPLIL